jgi:hypothetical protein
MSGATTQQLMSIFGWEGAAQAADYTKAASIKQLAEKAMHLLIYEPQSE